MTRRRAWLVILCCWPALGLATPAGASEALAKKSGCFACHSVASKVVGPAYRDVAAKYAGDQDAEARLVQSIRGGGSGKWGEIAMPPQANLSDQEAHRLARWILGGAH